MIDTPVEMLNGVIECNVGDCSHIERYYHPVGGLMSIQNHCEEEHGISEDEFLEQLDELGGLSDE